MIDDSCSYQHNVELVLKIQRLGLQTDRLARLFFQFDETSCLFIKQHFDNVLMRENQDLFEIELTRLPDDFAEDFETHCFCRHNEAATIATRAVLTQDMLQALPGSFARHFNEPERRYRGDLVAGVIARQRVLEHMQHIAAVVFLFHVDKIDNDNSTQISEPKLPANGDRRFEIGAINGFFQISMADIAARIHVNRRHRLSLIKYQVTS